MSMVFCYKSALNGELPAIESSESSSSGFNNKPLVFRLVPARLDLHPAKHLVKAK